MLRRATVLWLLWMVCMWTLGSGQLGMLKESSDGEDEKHDSDDSDKELTLNVRKLYGPEGERVRYDDYNRPYIVCNKHDTRICDPSRNPSCPREERCYPENQ